MCNSKQKWFLRLITLALLSVLSACSDSSKTEQAADYTLSQNDPASSAASNEDAAAAEEKLAAETTDWVANAGHAIGRFPAVDIATVPYSEALGEDEDGILEYKIIIDKGILKPDVLVVKKGRKIRLHIENQGSVPAEFESRSLRKEKVLYMGRKSSLIILPLGEGKYDIFDDFTPGHPGWIVAK